MLAIVVAIVTMQATASGQTTQHKHAHTTGDRPLSQSLTVVEAVSLGAVLCVCDPRLAAAAVCEPLAATSPCAQFYPAATNVTYPAFSPSTPFQCQRDLDRMVFGSNTQTVWNVISTLTPGTGCGQSVAQLMCMTMYRPCVDAVPNTVSDTICSAAVGATANCPASVQNTLLPLLISSWPTTFASCVSSPAFSPAGVTGVAAPLILPRCEFLANSQYAAAR